MPPSDNNKRSAPGRSIPAREVQIQQLREVKERALHLMQVLGRQELGTPLTELGWTFGFDKAKRRLGCCTWKRGRASVKRISISAYYAALNGLAHRDEQGLHVLEDVIRHEIAHAIEYEQHGASNHGARWQALCRRVGADPSRVYEGHEVNAAPGRYVARCPQCGDEQEYYRLPRRPRACAACCRRHNNGRYAGRFKYVLTDRRTGKQVSYGAERTNRVSTRRQTAGQSPKELGFKYTGICPNCGYQVGYRRKLKRARACRRCCDKYAGGAFDAAFTLEITQNY